MYVKDILQKPFVIPATISLATFGLGFGVGYILGKRVQTIEIHQDIVVELESEDADVFDEIIEIETTDPVIYNEIPQPEIEEDGLIKEFENSIHNSIQDEELEPVRVIRNVFTPVVNDQWVYEDEIAHREANPGEPCVIHYDEFMNNEMDFQQETLTYYKADDIVADQANKPIYNYSGLMGHLKFGHGSGDETVVYIRNATIHMEWEICLDDGSFETEVLGLQVEEEYEKADIKHSQVRRFRPD